MLNVFWTSWHACHEIAPDCGCQIGLCVQSQVWWHLMFWEDAFVVYCWRAVLFFYQGHHETYVELFVVLIRLDGKKWATRDYIEQSLRFMIQPKPNILKHSCCTDCRPRLSSKQWISTYFVGRFLRISSRNVSWPKDSIVMCIFCTQCHPPILLFAQQH